MNPPPYRHSRPLTLLSSVLPVLVFIFSHLLHLSYFVIFLFYFCSLCTFLFSFISFCGMYGERLLCQGLWGASMDRFRIRQEYQPYHIGSDLTFRKDIHSLFCSSYFLHCLLTIAMRHLCLFNKIHLVDLLLLSLFFLSMKFRPLLLYQL